MKISFFGSSLLSSYWNGAATYYRGIIRALHARGHAITFYEPDAYDRQAHRDFEPPAWARVVVYANRLEAVEAQLEAAAGADLVIKASGVGVFDAWLEAAVLSLQSVQTRVIFWDVDAPATLGRLHDDPADPFRALIPRYDAILTYGGGEPVVGDYTRLGARACVPIYNALDPSTHFPVAPLERFSADLTFLGNRLPDREARVDDFFFTAARRAPEARFLLGGSGWGDRELPTNTAYLGHVSTRDHNALNSSARLVLNISRESMARNGFSPATRVFEAAGAAACLITDAWKGIEQFLDPGTEILVAAGGDEVAQVVRQTDRAQAQRIGAAARRRVLAHHTYAQRAEQFEQALALESLAA